MSARYVHGANAAADDPLIWYTGTGSSTKRYLHADHLGSIVGVTNSSGSTQYKNAYDEYGLPDSDNQGRFQFTGQAWLSELGLYYYKARFYSPALGRFLQTDPVGYKGGANLYEYVGDDPLNLVDYSGTIPGDLFDTIEGAAEDVVRYINPQSISENREYGGSISFIDGKYVASIPLPGTKSKGPEVSIVGKAGWYHTHGDYSVLQPDGTIMRSTKEEDKGPGGFQSDKFSSDDKQIIRENRLYGFLGTPSGRILRMDRRSKPIRSPEPSKKKGNRNASQSQTDQTSNRPRNCLATGSSGQCGSGLDGI